MRLSSISALALALGLFAGAAARAEDAPAAATGTVTGKVVDKDDKAVANAEVKVVAHAEKAHKGEKVAEGGDKKDGGKKLMARTGADGAFSVANVPAGTYDVMVSTPDGRGRSAAPVTVKGGDTVDAGTITLTPKTPKGEKKAG